MKNNILRFLRPLFLISLATVLFATSKPSTPVFAGGSETPDVQEEARESVGSCDNQRYAIPEQIPVTGQDTDASAVLYFTQPLEIGKPVVGDLRLNIEEIDEINEIADTFTVEGVLEIIWCDPRQELVYEGQKDFIILVGANAAEKLDKIWWPEIIFTNEVEARDTADEELVIHRNGTIEYREKFTATLKAIYDLRKFPFDQQRLEIRIQSFAWDLDYLELIREESHEHVSGEFQIEEWSVEPESLRSTIESSIPTDDQDSVSQFKMDIDVTRKYDYYIWKVLFPLFLLVVMCFAVFWMEDADLSSRLGVSFTGVLTVVAYQFIATGSLPKVPYITLMDSYITLSFIIMVLTVGESLVVSGLNKKEKKTRALRLDKLSRIAFPLIYALGIAAATVWFLMPHLFTQLLQ